MPYEFSVRREVAAFADTATKRYLWTMGDHGLEMGFGRAGEYEAHSHRNLVDVVYSPQGFALASGLDHEPAVGGRLLVAAPHTWFGPMTLADFWFVKFYHSHRHTGVPDKSVDPADSRDQPQTLAVFDEPAMLRMSVYRPTTMDTQVCEIRLSDAPHACSFTIGGELVVTVVA